MHRLFAAAAAVAWAVTGAAIFFPTPLYAQGDPVQERALPEVMEAVPTPLPIQRIDAAIELDGVVDEAVWDEIEPLPMTMFAPSFGAPITERTEVRIFHDGEFLYVSGRMYDSDPSGIRSNTFYRDQYSGDDLLSIVIDSYNDHETGVWFSTNPAGTRADRSIANDAVFSGGPGSAMNWDWNAHWEVATARTEEGWFAEFRIPFSSLGFQVETGEVTMGFIVYRFIARKNERQLFPAINPRWGGLAFAKPSQAHRVVLGGVRRTTPVYLTPYVLAGAGRMPELVEEPGGEPAYRLSSEPTTEAGVDLRYAPAANLAFDVTLNTDFAQVEADDQQINLTRFPLFFPEKRQFFQERSSTFDFPTGQGRDRLFHSRRIGLEDGELARIYGGVRAVGRLGGLDFGALTMQTEVPGDESTQNLGVFRAIQQVLNPYSSVGAVVTSRLGGPGPDNVSYGLDASLRPFGDEWVDLRWAQSFDEAIDEGSTLEAGVLSARWERIQDEGFSYSAEAIRVGRDFNPGLGFQSRRDFHLLGGSGQFKRFRDADSPLRSLAFQLRTQHFFRNREGTAASRSVSPEIQWEFKGGVEATVKSTSSFESIREPFAIGDVEVPVGEYWFHEGEAQLQLSRSDLLRGTATVTAGSFYDGRRTSLSLEPSWTQSAYLELGGGYEVNRLEFPERDAATTTHLGRLRAQLALNTRVSLSALAQYSNVDDLGSLNARFRYHFREGTDLWVVYNEGWNVDRDPLERPALPGSAGRTLMVKYTHTFVR